MRCKHDKIITILCLLVGAIIGFVVSEIFMHNFFR